MEQVQPISTLSEETKAPRSFLHQLAQSAPVAAAFLSLLTVAVAQFLPNFVDGDSYYYISIASGRIREIQAPFTSRFLVPYLARSISSLAGIEISTAFVLIGVTSLFFLLWMVAEFLKSAAIPACMTFPLVFGSSLIHAYQNCYLPDLPHMALLAGFIRALSKRRWTLSLLLLFILCCVRESTLLVSAIVIIWAWTSDRRRYALALLVTTAVAMFVSGCITRLGHGNIHGFAGPLYMILKVPFNFFFNILGIELWTNTLFHPPIAKFDLPHWLWIGRVRQVGIVGLSSTPAYTLMQLLTVFGVLPICAIALRRQIRQFCKSLRMNRNEDWLLIPMVYGGVAYVIAPMLGASINRLILYGWPIVWIGLPRLLRPRLFARPKETVILICCQFLALWGPFWVDPKNPPGRIHRDSILQWSLLAFAQILAWYTIKEVSKGSIEVMSSEPEATA